MTQTVEATKTEISAIYIRPYVDATIENMGFEKEGIVLHDGTTHKEYLTCLEVHGVKRYITGLDEFAPEVERIKDEKQKKAVINQIREKVIRLEKLIAGNDRLKPEDPEFWSKVLVVRRDNHKFWDDVYIELGNDAIKLDPNNPHDFIKICSIEAGGFTEVAKSFNDARASGLRYKFYLDKADLTEDTKSNWKKLKNQAIAILEDLSEDHPKTLWYVAKNLDAQSYSYKKNTPQNVVYNNMDEFINGRGVERSVTKAAKLFIETAQTDLEMLKLQAYVRDAMFYKCIVQRDGQNYYHAKTNVAVGKTVEHCVQYLKDPANAKIWAAVQDEVEANWK